MSELTKMEKLLLHAGRVLTTTIDYEELMKLILELTIRATDADAALVYRIDRGVRDMRVRFMRCGEDKIKYFQIPKGEGLIGWVAENKEPQIVNNLKSDNRFSPDIEKYIEYEFRSAVAVPLIGRGQMIAVVEAVNKRQGEFVSADQDTLVGLANQFAVAIANANLYRDARRRAAEQRQLYEVSKKLSSTLKIEEVLKQILDSLKLVVGFTAGGVFLIDEKKDEVKTIFSQGYERGNREFLQLKMGQGLVGWVARSGKAVNVPDVAEDKRYVPGHPDTKSEIAVPIEIDGRILGVLNLESDERDFYGTNDLDLLTAFASAAAISIERAMLHDRMVENKRLEEQLKIARQIQLSFLPNRDPDIPGYEISGVNIPSGGVGGDYFDFIKIIDNQMGIAIADVSGKGIPAALIMASYRASLIAEIRNNYAIRTICKKVNSLLYESVEQGNFVTAFYGVLDSKNDIFTFSNCGHNPPIHIKSDGRVEYLKEGGVAFGVVKDSDYEERPIFLQTGDMLAFYTDGVTEVNNEKGIEFGEKSLLETLKDFRKFPAREVHRKIVQTVRDYASPDHVFDDLTMIIVKKQ